nr:hypothetical protein [Nocardioides flavescens]
MLWVSWVGRERAELDQDEAVRRLGAALDKEPRLRRARTRPGARDRSTPARSSGVAVRRTPPRPRGLPRNPDAPPAAPATPVDENRRERRERRAS